MWILLLKRYWWVIAVIVAVIAYMIWIENLKETQQDLGVATERGRSLEGVVQDVETANEARTEVSSATSVVKYCQCLRSSRDASSCTRYLPTGYANNSKSASICNGSD